MNEKIKELSTIAWDYATKNSCDGDGKFGHLHRDKFAELIIKECAAYIDANIGYDDCNNTYPVSGCELKDHFGVKDD